MMYAIRLPRAQWVARKTRINLCVCVCVCVCARARARVPQIYYRLMGDAFHHYLRRTNLCVCGCVCVCGGCERACGTRAAAARCGARAGRTLSR